MTKEDFFSFRGLLIHSPGESVAHLAIILVDLISVRAKGGFRAEVAPRRSLEAFHGGKDQNQSRLGSLMLPSTPIDRSNGAA